MMWFIIIGRVLFDDEDTINTYQTTTVDKATKAFRKDLKEPGRSDEIIINAIITCETEPKVETF